MPPFGPLVTANQSDLRPNRLRKSAPDTVTDPLVPSTTSWTTRPPRSPRPLRLVTLTASSVPIDGYAFWMSPTGMLADHVWFGLDGVASPSSTTAGNTPPAV